MNKPRRSQVGILKINNKDFAIFEGVNTIGRNKEAIVNIKYLNISQNHAVLVVINGSHFISDLNSSNGSFLENQKLEAFKLYEVKNNSTFKFGDLSGMYITEGPFFNNDQHHFDMTQDVTQSFYGSNTQILDNTKTINTNNESEDFHEAPTQEISWADFKVPKSKKATENDIKNIAAPTNNTKIQDGSVDIKNSETQVIENLNIPKNNQSKEIGHSSKTNNVVQTQNNRKMDVSETKKDEEDIHNAPTQAFSLLPKKPNEGFDANISEPEIFGPFNDETLPFLEDNDNYVEVHQITKIDKHLDIHEAATEVMDISKRDVSSVSNTNQENDETTDCDDNTQPELDNKLCDANYLTKNRDGISTPDEDTDCEDNTQDTDLKLSTAQVNKSKFVESDNESNDSIEFFGIDKSVLSSKDTISKTNRDLTDNNSKKSCDNADLSTEIENCSDEIIHFKKKKVCYLGSDSDSDDNERIGFKRKKKSLMVISTQDICENNVNSSVNNTFDPAGIKSNKQDNYFIENTDSEDETEIKCKDSLEDSIPATQNMTTDFNDSDCIPVTQNIVKQVAKNTELKSPNRKSGSGNGSSEESFKLGLTELLTNPSENISNYTVSQDPCCSKSLKNPSPSFGELSLKNNKLVDKSQVEDINTTSYNTNIYTAATQQIISPDIDNKSVTEQNASDIYFAPTQKVDISKKLSTIEESVPETECLYEIPTQKIGVKEPEIKITKKTHLDEMNNEIYFAPTQKIDISEKVCSIEEKVLGMDETEFLYDAPTQQIGMKEPEIILKKNTQLNETNSDIYFAPTQKVVCKVAEESVLGNTDETECLYDAPTQQIGMKEPEIILKKNTQLNETNSDIYFAPTQKVVYKDAEESVLGNTNETECLYDAPTQKIGMNEPEIILNKNTQLDETNSDIYFAPTQKVVCKVAEVDQNTFKEEMDDLYLQPTQQLEDTFNQPTQKVSIPVLESDCNEHNFTQPNSAVRNLNNGDSHGKKKFSFKKNTSNLDGSLTTLLDPAPKHITSHSPLRDKRSSIELELDDSEIVSNKMSTRPSNPLSYVLDHSSQIDNTSITKEKDSSVIKKPYVENESNEKVRNVGNKNNYCENKPILNKTKFPDLTKSNAVREDVTTPTLKRSRRTKVQTDDKAEIKTSSGIKIKEHLTEDRVSKGNNLEGRSDNKIRARRTTRRLSSASSDTKVSNIKKESNDKEPQIESDDNESQVNPILTNRSLNTTNSEVNQSIAFMESKITKSRKKTKSSEIQVKVPKSRKSMTISEIDEAHDTSSTSININNNVQLNPRKKPETTTISTKRRGRPKKEIEQSINKNETTEVKKDLPQNQPFVKQCPSKSNNFEALTTTTFTSTVAISACNKSKQAGKRKQVVAELKSESSDTSLQSIDSNLTTPKKRKLQPSRQVGKRKQATEIISDSDISTKSEDSNLVTPKKQKIETNEALLNTKERGLRKQKPKVVFTMLESPQLESMIKQLGGSVVDDVIQSTVLLTEHVKRSQKLLSAVGLGKPICSPKWITDSKKSHEFLDPWDYILTDPEAENKWKFSLKESLNKSRTNKLLDKYHFQIMVSSAVDVLKGAIESCGGKCLSRIPSKPLENTFIISTPENQSKYKRVIKQHPDIKVIEPEAIFDGVLRQELRFSKHYVT